MKLIHDVPRAHVHEIGQDRRMLVAYAEEISAHPEYLQFYREALDDNKFVILSSLVQAGHQVVDDLIRAAVKLKPSEVVLPNIPVSRDKSERLTGEVSSLLQSAGVDRTPFMAVPHGDDFREYLESVTKLATYSQVRTIGVTVDVFDKFHLTRKAFFAAMRKACPRTMHLLGLSDDLADLTDPQSAALFRSASTPKAVVWGLAGKTVLRDSGEVPEYGGREQFGGETGFMAFSTDVAAKIKTANKNITDWDG